MTRSALYTQLVVNALFPVHEWLKGHTSVRVRKQLEQSQWWSPERLAALQVSRLSDLLVHAQEHVPYFRSRFAELGFDARGVTSLAALQHLPLLDKKTIRKHTEQLKADNARPLTRFNTGGSSGEPLIFFIGKERVSHDVAAKWRATRWWGVDIGDPEIVVWGSPIELGKQDRMKQWRDWMLRTRLLSAFQMSAAKLDEFVEVIERVRPPMLFGYPSALSHIARHADATGKTLNSLGIKVAFVTSEKLYDEQRQVIENTFGCAVANGYGGRDAGFIAHQCPQGGMHITAEDIVVEIVDEGGTSVPTGEAGEIVITHLATRDFPFIRYRTGDVGVLGSESCPCGRSLPLLREIQGRSTDFVVSTDGTVMHGLALIYVLREIPGIENFKITQHSLENTTVQIEVNATFANNAIEIIQQGIKARLGSTVVVGVEQVPRIEPEASGKHRYIVSHVSPP